MHFSGIRIIVWNKYFYLRITQGNKSVAECRKSSYQLQTSCAVFRVQSSSGRFGKPGSMWRHFRCDELPWCLPDMNQWHIQSSINNEVLLETSWKCFSSVLGTFEARCDYIWSKSCCSFETFRKYLKHVLGAVLIKFRSSLLNGWVSFGVSLNLKPHQHTGLVLETCQNLFRPVHISF